MSSPRIAVLASGGGRSLENLARLAREGELDVEIALVVTDRPNIGVLDRAEAAGIPTLVVPYRATSGSAEFSRIVFDAIDACGCELTVLAGFLRLLTIPPKWLGRVLNIHPALLPAFGGKGYYGDRVHAAVLEAGVPETGCTVHFVDNEYDNGPHVLQRRVEVRAGDTTEVLAARVFEAEKLALPEAIRRVLSGEASYAT